MAKKGQTLNNVSKILLIVGGVNWGLSSVFGLNLVDKILSAVSAAPVVGKVIYGAVGLAAVYKIFTFNK